MSRQVIIIGAGLVGSLLSIYLRRRGYPVTIYERRPDMRREAMSAGRSINLALSDRGILALEEVGIMDEIRKIAIPMHGRQVHTPDGKENYQPYGKEGQYINSVSRGELNKKLMDLAEQAGAVIHFNERCDKVDWKNHTIVFEHTQNGKQQLQSFELLFGSDGAFSAARLSYQLQQDRFQYQQHYIDFGYKELSIPAGPNGSWQMKKEALHIWPRGNYMLIALPNTDGSFTCTLFFPYEGDPSFKSLDTVDKAAHFFQTTFSDAYALMPHFREEFSRNPTASLVTVKCKPWTLGDYFALIGDAAHAIVPFFGQGMNCGFEDCRILNQLIDIHREDWSAILPAYEHLRKPDGDAIADLALNNFIEMRDKVNDPVFLLQKKIEAQVSQHHPDKWIPAYSQVTFSPHIRYSEALANGLRQQAIMDRIMVRPDIEKEWDSEEIRRLILHEAEKQLTK